MLDITNVINVSVNSTPSGLTDYEVNNVALFTSEAFASNPNDDVYRSYVGATPVGTDFGTGGETYAQAVALFSQQPNILNGDGNLIIVPYLQGAVSTVSITAGGASYEVGDILTISGGDTDCTLRVDTVSTGAVTAVTILTRGSGYATGAGQATTSPSGGTGCTINITAIAQESLVDAIERVKESVFFVGVISTNYPASNDMESASDSIQAMGNKVLILPSATFSDIAGAFTDIKDAGNDKTRCIYHATSALEARLMAAAYAGVLFSPNYNASNSTLTMNLKQLRTISPDLTITQTIADACDTAGVDIYPSIAGLGKIKASSANNDSDVVVGIIWLVSQLQVKGFNALAQTNTKLPQTEPGVSVLKTAYREACQEAVNNAFVAPGEWTSPDTFGNQLDFLDNIRNVGYYIYSQPVSQQSAEDRALHKAPTIQIAVKLAGWIGSSNVILNVNP